MVRAAHAAVRIRTGHPEGRRNLLNKVLEYVPSKPVGLWMLDVGPFICRSLVARWRVIAVDAGPGLPPAWQWLPDGTRTGRRLFVWPSELRCVMTHPGRYGQEWCDRLAAKPCRVVLIHCGLESSSTRTSPPVQNGIAASLLNPST